jgi:hypothetical protein
VDIRGRNRGEVDPAASRSWSIERNIARLGRVSKKVSYEDIAFARDVTCEARVMVLWVVERGAPICACYLVPLSYLKHVFCLFYRVELIILVAAFSVPDYVS